MGIAQVLAFPCGFVLVLLAPEETADSSNTLLEIQAATEDVDWSRCVRLVMLTELAGVLNNSYLRCLLGSSTL